MEHLGIVVSALQNTYTAVVISPQNLSQSNPDLYNSLKMSDFMTT